MRDDERRALDALRIEWAPTYEDVWASVAAHVESLNNRAAAVILASIDEIAREPRHSPLGIPLIGQHGAGKTHMLRWAPAGSAQGRLFHPGRSRARPRFLAEHRVVVVGRLQCEDPRHADQLDAALGAALPPDGTEPDVREQIVGRQPLTPLALAQFIRDLRRMDNRVGRACQDTARALVLCCAQDPDAQDLADQFLRAREDGAAQDWAQWGLRRLGKSSREIAAEISRLLSLTGPSLLAVDQIDTLIADMDASYDDDGGITVTQARLLERAGDGLMDLRQAMPRTLIVVACMTRTWDLLKRNSTEAAVDRFRPALGLGHIPSDEVGRALVEAWFGPQFKRVGFEPSYPSWPIRREAFADAPFFSPRGLLKAVSVHVERCLEADEVVELARLREVSELAASGGDGGAQPQQPQPQPAPVVVEQAGFAALDSRFEGLRLGANTARAFEREHEDALMAWLLAAGLNAWRIEQGFSDAEYWVEPDAAQRGAFHARLHQSLDEATEDERRWAFKAIAAANSRAAQARLDRIRGLTGSGSDSQKRKAYVVRRGAWPSGKAMSEMVATFTRAGGVVLDADPADLEVFAALATMLDEPDPVLREWLAARRPAGRTGLLTAVFGPPQLPAIVTAQPSDPPSGGAADDGFGSAPSSGAAASSEPGPVDTLPIGSTVDRGEPVRVSLESLRKHTAIFAGSGSGKTVLIRRLIEESALLGVSSIVLDPNNDLARLGDAWPEPPRGWGSGDAAKAADYLASVDVVVWTPRREAGRPLSLRPLPDFAAVRDDPDEFALALDNAVATLAPRARISGATAKAEAGRAVLREALKYLGRRGGGLVDLIDLMSELPEGISSLAKASDIAADLAQTLRAAMINDPLFGGTGVSLDPEVLFTPVPGKRARVSVISFVGLPTNEQRQGFVNQLQMALFAWIKQHPAGDRPLGGLYVMDEAQTLAPSGEMTACTGSTLALASQARKYGLGLVFATQSPRGIHNRIVGNAAGQFYGFLNSPAQIQTAKEMAAAKASGVVDISRRPRASFMWGAKVSRSGRWRRRCAEPSPAQRAQHRGRATPGTSRGVGRQPVVPGWTREGVSGGTRCSQQAGTIPERTGPGWAQHRRGV